MNWFNYNKGTFEEMFKPSYQDSLRKHLGRMFIVKTKKGYSHRARYCQIANRTYRFIHNNGNRIVDDNSEIKSAKIVKRKGEK